MATINGKPVLNAPKLRSGPVVALDIGTTKISCFIGHADDNGALRVKGIGHHRSTGIRNGRVVDMEAAEACIRAAVGHAEQSAETVVDSVIVNVSGGKPRSDRIEIDVEIDGHCVNESDLRRVEEAVRGSRHSGEHLMLHNIPVSYTLDGAGGIHDPRGMFGKRLGVSMHRVTAQGGPLRNLESVIRRCHLRIEDWIVSPYAAALGCLVPDALELGATCIDMGGGTTSIAVFQNGHFVHATVLPVGGQHVTNDIAHGLSTPVSKAERLKTLYGSALSMPSDRHETLKIELLNEEDDSLHANVPRSVLNQIIQPRIEEIFEMVRAHLDSVGLLKGAGRLVVLTGGAAQMQGVRDVAALILDKQVRIAGPQGVKGLAEATQGPAFSTCAGLLRFGLTQRAKRPVPVTPDPPVAKFGLGKIGTWLQQNF